MARKFRFGTKAETLERLAPLLRVGRVLPVHYFEVAHYRDRPDEIAEHIARKFSAARVAIRSSARGEDGADHSMAGAFDSVLDVPSGEPELVHRAIGRVIRSYAGDPEDHVLVQPMVSSSCMAGVAMTRDLEHGSNYLVVNYDDESGRTDSITGGTGVNKTLAVHWSARERDLHSDRIRTVVRGVREVEALVPDTPLDIEFALEEDGALVILQVRPITLHARWAPGIAERVDQTLEQAARLQASLMPPPKNVLGRRTIHGEMPDWNPAEMIGTTPTPLAASLYRHVITRSVWAEARAAMGYRRVDEELMQLFAGHPYIDTRLSFNSFLPEGLPDEVGTRLIEAWIDRLEDHPELHDKVEFDVALTCTDFTVRRDLSERYPGLLRAPEARDYLDRLTVLTARNMDVSDRGTLAVAERAVASLAARQADRRFPESPDEISNIRALLDEAIDWGTRPFSILARHGFIAESLLRSAVEQAALTSERSDAFRRSVRTVGTSLVEALHALRSEPDGSADFMRRFGHLRPGSYNVTSPCYRLRAGMLQGGPPTEGVPDHTPFLPTPEECAALELLLADAGLQAVTAQTFFEYARRAIQGREYGKFVFTRNLSDVLEIIAIWGASSGFDRAAVAHVPIEVWSNDPAPAAVAAEARRGAESLEVARAIRLGSLIRGPEDLRVVPTPRAAANFIGDQCLHAPVICLDDHPDSEDLAGKLVCVRNADPGYDWIFTRGIAGLITEYGGANSHMAIRSAEFGLPAAIGCGEQVYERVRAAREVELNCHNRTIAPLLR